MQAHDKHSTERPQWESCRAGGMCARAGPQPGFSNALYMIDGSRKDKVVVGVRFHARTPHILIMTELFFATCDDCRRARSLGQGMDFVWFLKLYQL